MTMRPQADRFKLAPSLKMLVIVLITHAVLAVGCHAPKVISDPNRVSRELFCRTGLTAEPVAPCDEVIPTGVILEDGVSEDEAVQTALSNNSTFQATLAQLGMAGGDSVQANLIANPQILIYFPTGAKEGQYTLYAPIESYFLRPTRVKVANREYRRVGDQLVQNGLNLARDVRLAHTDFVLADGQAQLAREAFEIRSHIVELTKKRLQDGDISELETITANVDMLNARAANQIQLQAVSIAEARLATLIGLTKLTQPLTPVPLTQPSFPATDETQLISQALACRPDYHAASWAVAAALERSHLSRWLFWRIDSVLDVRNGPAFEGSGGGLRADIPIFNRNQGGILRADWELNAARHTRDAIHDQIVGEVRTAIRQLQQAQENLAILNDEIGPALADALTISQKGFADGGTDYLLVLQTTSQYLDARTRILVQTAACNRAIAELERSVGRNLSDGMMDIEALAQASLPADEAQELAELIKAPVIATAAAAGLVR